MLGEFVSSKTLSSPVDHLFTVKVRSVCEEFVVSSLWLLFLNFEHVHYQRRAILQWVVSRLLSRWRRQARWIDSATPCYKKNHKKDALHAARRCHTHSHAHLNAHCRTQFRCTNAHTLEHMHHVVRGVGGRRAFRAFTGRAGVRFSGPWTAYTKLIQCGLLASVRTGCIFVWHSTLWNGQTQLWLWHVLLNSNPDRLCPW